MAVAARPRTTELLERAEPLARLHEAYADALRGRGALLFVAGEAGVGKTALAHRFTDELDAEALWGRCDPFVAPPPLGPLLEVAVGTRDLADAIQTDAGAHAIAGALLGTPRGRTPLVVVLEDLHWADEATLDVLRVLGRRVAATPTLVVATYRADELDRTHPLRIVLG